MTRDLTRLAGARFDLLVIGGGIHGLAIAYDAAQRGYSVALVERADFGSGSSFNHAKTVHGGLRSLQSGDIAKARFSVCERRAMARIAPHLVAPLSFMMATTRKFTRSGFALRVGFALDALIGFDRNAGVHDDLHLRAGQVLPLADYRAVFGANARADATGAGCWNDYHMPESDRLTLAFATAAEAHGARLANYVEAIEPLREGARVCGARVWDRIGGGRFEVEAGLTINAAGAQVRPWMQQLGAAATFPLLKAMNLVTSRPAGPVAMGAPTSDGRLLLIMPWRGRMLVGTSHSAAGVDPADTAVSPSEMEAFVAEVNSAFPALALSARDVTLVHRGVVPAEADRHGALQLMRHHRVHDHAAHGLAGAVSVVGVKYTTARGVAEQVVNLAGRKLARRMPPCRTGVTPLAGPGLSSLADEAARAQAETRGLLTPDAAAALTASHGTAWREIAALCRASAWSAEPIAPGLHVPRAVVEHAVHHEMAMTLADLVLRRTSIGSAGHPGDAIVGACAAAMARVCGWDPDRTAGEVAALRAFYAPVAP